MHKAAKKVAISLPDDLFRAVEKRRRKSGRSRSAILQEALRRMLRQEREEEWIRQYEEGYRRMPETREEIEAVEAVSIPALMKEEW